MTSEIKNIRFNVSNTNKNEKMKIINEIYFIKR